MLIQKFFDATHLNFSQFKDALNIFRKSIKGDKTVEVLIFTNEWLDSEEGIESCLLLSKKAYLYGYN